MSTLSVVEDLKVFEDRVGDALVVAKVDRLSRSLFDFTTVMERSRKQGWALVALDVGVDTTTPAGELVANTMASFAHFERRIIGQRTKDALAVKRVQEVRLGRPRTLPDKVVNDIGRQRARGRSYRAIADNLNQRAVPTAPADSSGARRPYARCSTRPERARRRNPRTGDGVRASLSGSQGHVRRCRWAPEGGVTDGPPLGSERGVRYVG